MITLSGSTVLGRGENVGALVTGRGSELVSANHAELTVRQDGVVVRDLGSTNGTYVNGVRIDESDLKGGDVLRLAVRGPEFVVHVPVEVGQARPSPHPTGRHGRAMPMRASRFRRWLGLSTR
ncbi:MAG: FHA domain-containing protein [Acidobacteria bacterium]|nr:FHA domain-containing protein [Acidobacteriota bacterium]